MNVRVVSLVKSNPDDCLNDSFQRNFLCFNSLTPDPFSRPLLKFEKIDFHQNYEQM